MRGDERAMTDHDLPDLFRFDDGTRVQTRADWARRRREIAAVLVPVEYGALPPAPAKTTAAELHRSLAPHFDGAEFRPYRVSIAGSPAV